MGPTENCEHMRNDLFKASENIAVPTNNYFSTASQIGPNCFGKGFDEAYSKRQLTAYRNEKAQFAKLFKNKCGSVMWDSCEVNAVSLLIHGHF